MLSLLMCGVAAGISVLVETYGWWDIDAGTSWTAVLLLGYVIALLHGGFLARKMLNAISIVAGATIIGFTTALPLAVGFGLKVTGIGVPWRAPAGSVLLAAAGNWLVLAVLILVAFGLVGLARRVCGKQPAAATG